MNSPTRPRSPAASAGRFEQVGERPYGYSSNGIYYARLEEAGKELRRSLRTTDRPLAKRRLAGSQAELGGMRPAGDLPSLADLRARYLATVRHQGRQDPQKQARGAPPRERTGAPNSG